MRSTTLLLPLGCLALAPLSLAQQWAQRSPAAAPAARNSHAMSFDIARGYAVAFGGYNGNDTTALADTWTYDGANWTQRTPSAAPEARWGHAMVFDQRRARTVLFGGFRPNVGSVADTWEFDGTNWAQLVTSNAPAGRSYHAMTYDAVRNRTVVFGGLGNANATLGDTWTFNGVDWTQVATTLAPSARRGAGFAFDSTRGVSMLFGGGNGTATTADTWTFDGTAWTQRTTTAAPSARWQPAMTFDAIRNRILLHGGADTAYATNYGDTWEWDGNAWSQTATTGPSARHGAGIAYDTRRGAVVLAGGRGAAGFVGDTWESSSFRTSGGMRFDGGLITFQHNPVMLTGNACTIEGWVSGMPNAQGTIALFQRVSASAEHKLLSVESDGRVNYLYAGSPWHQLPRQDLRTPPGTFPKDGQFHHLAFVRRSNATWSVYLDGSRIVNMGPGTALWAGCWLTCAVIETSSLSTVAGDPNARGWSMRNLRVSNNERYSGASFTPSEAWSPDANSVMLLNFSEGSGATTRDAGPAQQVGTISGAVTWLSSPTPTPTATFTTYGTGCQHSTGTPQLSTAPASAPRLGQTLQLRLSNLPANSSQLPFGFFATRNESAIGLPLPFSMARYGMNSDCLQYVDPDSGLVFTLLNNAGTANWDLGIPNDPALLQLSVFFQGMVIDWALADALPAAVTNAGVATIGR